MASERRLAANRENAKRSTGPTTSAGKKRSARNARRHGFSSSEFSDFSEEDHTAADLISDQDDDPSIRDLALTIANVQRLLRCVRLAKLAVLKAARSRRIETHPVKLLTAALYSLISAIQLGGSKELKRAMRELQARNRALGKFKETLESSQSLRHYEVVRNDTEAALLAHRELQSLDRYERRAIARRNRAIERLDAIRHLRGSGR